MTINNNNLIILKNIELHVRSNVVDVYEMINNQLFEIYGLYVSSNHWDVYNMSDRQVIIFAAAHEYLHKETDNKLRVVYLKGKLSDIANIQVRHG